jgi:hypothetical protein
VWGLAWQVFNRFFWGTQALNKSEKDQPAPLEVQREHLEWELAKVNKQIRYNQTNEFNKKEASSEDEAP